VPTLIVGDVVLVGSLEIPELFPGIIEEGLRGDGILMPEIPGLQEAIDVASEQATTQGETATPPVDATKPSASPAALTPETQAERALEESNPPIPSGISDSMHEELSWRQKFMLDAVGNGASVVVLVWMLISVIIVGMRLLQSVSVASEHHPSPRLRWAIPLLSVIGLVAAGYLLYVEITHTEAVCGLVGDCNTVQQSPYAHLFGVVPLSMLGLVGYMAVMVAWLVQYYGAEHWRRYASLAVWGMTFGGTLFSIYLTFLEPFVIGATCAWCLTSAIVITLQLWAAVGPAQRALHSLFSSSLT
jgi:uncharacterized membrane protein